MKKILLIGIVFCSFSAKAQLFKSGHAGIPTYSTSGLPSNVGNGEVWINSDSSKMQFKFSNSIFTLGGSNGATSFTFQNSLVNNAGVVTLVNDNASPGNLQYYGTNSSGTLGYFTLPTISGLTSGVFPVATASNAIGNSNFMIFNGGFKFLTGSGLVYSTTIGNNGVNQFRGSLNIFNDSSGYSNFGASQAQQNSAVMQANGAVNFNGNVYFQASATTLGRLEAFGSSFYIDAYASGGTLIFRTNGFSTTALQLLSAGTAQFLTPTASASSINLPAGTSVTSPNSGDLFHVNGHLYFRDQSTTYDLLASSGSTPTLQQVVTAGSTFTGANNITNTGQTFTWTNGGTGLWKWSGNSEDTTNTAGVNITANDSSQRMIPWAKFAIKLADYLPAYNIYPANGLTAGGSDSVYLGGTLNQTTTIANAGFDLSITGAGQTDIGGTSAPNGTRLTIEGNTSYAPASGSNGMLFNTNIGGTNTDATTSGTASFNALTYSFNPITLAATHTVTYPVAATLFINTPPVAGTNVTITNAYSLYINSGASYFNGNVTGTVGAMGTFTHVLGNNATSTPPTITAGSGAGTSPTVAIQGTDMDGSITVTTGTTPSISATVATVTYGYAFPTHSYVVLYPSNAITAALGVNMVYTTGGTTNFTLTSSATGLTAATTYQWYYHVGGY